MTAAVGNGNQPGWPPDNLANRSTPGLQCHDDSGFVLTFRKVNSPGEYGGGGGGGGGGGYGAAVFVQVVTVKYFVAVPSPLRRGYF